jgi:hypothetical protein
MGHALLEITESLEGNSYRNRLCAECHNLLISVFWRGPVAGGVSEVQISIMAFVILFASWPLLFCTLRWTLFLYAANESWNVPFVCVMGMLFLVSLVWRFLSWLWTIPSCFCPIAALHRCVDNTMYYTVLERFEFTRWPNSCSRSKRYLLIHVLSLLLIMITYIQVCLNHTGRCWSVNCAGI